MKKLLLILFVSTFLMSCVKDSVLNNVPVEEQLLTESALAPVIIGGQLENLNDLPASVLTLVNGSYTQQYSSQTVSDLTPNLPVFSDGKFYLFGKSFEAIYCPPPPPPVGSPSRLHVSVLSFNVGGLPRPGCTIIPSMFNNISFTFTRISNMRLALIIKYSPTNTIIYSRPLLITKEGSKTYISNGVTSNQISSREALDYYDKPNQQTITPIVTKFFNFFSINLTTSN